MQKKIAITIDENLLSEIDYLVEQKIYPSRSKAIVTTAYLSFKIEIAIKIKFKQIFFLIKEQSNVKRWR